MDAYAQALALLDTHYSHMEGWVRIVYSYRIVEYCKVAEVALPADEAALDEVMAVIDGWWYENRATE